MQHVPKINAQNIFDQAVSEFTDSPKVGKGKIFRNRFYHFPLCWQGMYTSITVASSRITLISRGQLSWFTWCFFCRSLIKQIPSWIKTVIMWWWNIAIYCLLLNALLLLVFFLQCLRNLQDLRTSFLLCHLDLRYKLLSVWAFCVSL